MKVPCPNCGAIMKISEAMINKNGRCPVCKAVLYVYEEKDGQEVPPPANIIPPNPAKPPATFSESKPTRTPRNAMRTVHPNAIIDGLVNINCPKCSTELELPENRINTRETCPTCREVFRIVESEEELWEFFHHPDSQTSTSEHTEEFADEGTKCWIGAMPLFFGCAILSFIGVGCMRSYPIIGVCLIVLSVCATGICFFLVRRCLAGAPDKSTEQNQGLKEPANPILGFVMGVGMTLFGLWSLTDFWFFGCVLTGLGIYEATRNLISLMSNTPNPQENKSGATSTKNSQLKNRGHK